MAQNREETIGCIIARQIFYIKNINKWNYPYNHQLGSKTAPSNFGYAHAKLSSDLYLIAVASQVYAGLSKNHHSVDLKCLNKISYPLCGSSQAMKQQNEPDHNLQPMRTSDVSPAPALGSPLTL